MDENLLPKESLLHYLQIGADFYGSTKNPERFIKFTPSGLPETVEKTDANGTITGRQKLYYKDRPLCFDYTMVSNRYGIDLDTEVDGEQKQTKDTYVMTDAEQKALGLEPSPL
ncbi:hypothetical protein DW064_02985 [Segatella copri]|nr:hypothetical protein DW064_02985 [Segatella copri]